MSQTKINDDKVNDNGSLAPPSPNPNQLPPEPGPSAKPTAPVSKCQSELDLLRKNRSSLFLIKSYSFIDKSSKLVKRSKSEVAEMESQSVDSEVDSNSDDLMLLRRRPNVNGDNDFGEKLERPRSLPATSQPGNATKRESFLRQSFRSIRRSFTNKKPSSAPASSIAAAAAAAGGGVGGPAAASSAILSSSSSGGSERTNCESDFEVVEVVNGGNVRTTTRSNLGDLKEEEDENRIAKPSNGRTGAIVAVNRSTSSVSTLSHSAPGSPMAPLQGYTETQSVNCLNDIGKTNKSNSSPYGITQSNSTIPFTIASKGDNKALRQTSSTPFSLVSSSANLQGVNPQPKVTIVSKNDVPEKEKKRKEVSSSRLKKFHRHFTQVSKDERVINYFSCALVSDILLQGHLYITDHHFAFYSNVFGYVTKVVIPTSSVTRISKEKVAKIIPNAVGVATADERHVFGSFLSRESAFRLMCSVCPTETPAPLLPKALPDVEISEEYSIEDDSSCSISGNESPPQAGGRPVVSDQSHSLIRRTNAGKAGTRSDSPNAKNSTDSAKKNRTAPPVPSTNNNANTNPTASCKIQQQALSSSSAASCASIPTAAALVGVGVTVPLSSATIITSTSSTSSASSSSVGNGQASSSSSSPNTVVFSPSTAFKAFSQSAIVRLKFPTEFNIVYCGVVLSLILAMFSGFLLYRIMDIEAKTSLYRSTVEFNWGAGNDADVFAEALRWQKELQSKSTEEAQNILHSNLQQIAKVRRSLETLSMLIHDKSTSTSSFAGKSQGDVTRDDTD